MCGTIGIVGNREVAPLIPLCSYDLQHRGEQGAGIATSDGKNIYVYKEKGLVTEVFSDEEIEGVSKREAIIRKLPGRFGIGHTLYSTVGKEGERKQTKTFQPLVGYFYGEQFALAHNGNLINLDSLRKEVEQKGYKFQSQTSDTEVIIALISTSEKKVFLEAILEILPRLEGAFALVILYGDKVIGIRDRYGIRPLCLGALDISNSFIIASEECAFHTLGGYFIREIRPGELIILSENGIENSMLWFDNPSLRLCVIELVYFARPDSTIGGRKVYFYREGAGQTVALENPIKNASLVSSVPESGAIYNYGVSYALNIPVRRVISRNRYYAGRTFLYPRDVDKRSPQRTKFYILQELVRGKIIIITEDSIIRGNVVPEVIEMLRLAGAAEVHTLVGSAPIRYPCFFGIDFPTQKELVAFSRTIAQVREHIRADSLGYLSLDGMIRSSGLLKENLCLGCFTGEYPIDPPEDLHLIKPPSC